MATKKKNAKKKSIPLPDTAYPTSPYIIGMNWIELSVGNPARTHQLYQAIGLQPRVDADKGRMLGVGGLVIRLRKKSAAQDEAPASPLTLEMACDNVHAKRDQLVAMGLKPTPLRKSKRGDLAFTWRDEDGYNLRFVGPDRREGDKPLH